MQVVKLVAPSCWASYLINGDASGIDPAERMDCDAWIIAEGMGGPVSCEDYGFTYNHDAIHYAPYGADCQGYTFLIPEEVR